MPSIEPKKNCRYCQSPNPPGSRFCNKCGADLTIALQPDGALPAGAVLRGSYVIENLIGDGGMGMVYSCHHKTLGTRYAIKVLYPHLVRLELIRRRFLSEARIQATVVHPHIVHVLDVIDCEKDGAIPGLMAFVMEFVDGEPLNEILSQRGPLSEKDAVSCALVILDAIGFAHHAGIVHRDLKPSNIMVSKQDAKEALYRGIKVMDFGIAKILAENDQRTATGAIMGTHRYMAPEQIENARSVDGRTDLYAIGLMLYEMLCGRSPFEEYKEFELLKAHMSVRPPSMRTYRNDISDRLETIVMKALEKDRNNRYPDAESFQRALLSLGGYEDIALRLNPHDGVAVVTSTQIQKLQRQVNRAVARAKNDAAKNDADKQPQSDATPKPQKNSQPAKKVNSAPTDAQTDTRSHSKQISKEKLCRTSSRAKSRRDMTAVQNQKPSNKTHADIQKTPDTTLKKSSNKTHADIQKTPDTAVKKSSNKTHADIQKAPDTAVKKPSNKTHADIQKTPDTTLKKSSNKTHADIQKTPDTAVKKSSNKTHADIQKTPDTAVKKSSNKTHADIQKAPSSPLKNTSAAMRAQTTNKGLKIFVAVVLLLVAIVITYRAYRDFPAPIVTDASQPQTTENTTIPDKADEKIQDISLIPVVEKQTPTGLMTHIPAAVHWITDSRGNTERKFLDAFDIDQTEVTYFEYEKCVKASKCPPTAIPQNDVTLPVTGVAFGTAQAFCRFAGKQLPTAEQWEAAARFGGEKRPDAESISCERVHCGSGKTGECQNINPPNPERAFKRSASANHGHLLNMLGNVREWTTDEGSTKQTRLTMGGSYKTRCADTRVNAREAAAVNTGEPDVGFRCVRLN